MKALVSHGPAQKAWERVAATVEVGESGNASDLAATAEERPRARGVGVRSCHARALGRTAPRHRRRCRRREAPSRTPRITHGLPRRRTESRRSGLAPGERGVDGGLKVLRAVLLATS